MFTFNGNQRCSKKRLIPYVSFCSKKSGNSANRHCIQEDGFFELKKSKVSSCKNLDQESCVKMISKSKSSFQDVSSHQIVGFNVQDIQLKSSRILTSWGRGNRGQNSEENHEGLTHQGTEIIDYCWDKNASI